MDMEKEAMEILMLFGKGGHVMDSGGKDSTVLKEIAWKCHEKYGLQYDIIHNHTTIDAPETVYFVRAERERERAWNRVHDQLPGNVFRSVVLEERNVANKDSAVLL